MAFDAARYERDQQMRAFHDERVRHGERRVLARASTGELVSYLREEYGINRKGLGPNITTFWGHCVYVIGITVLVVFLSSAIAGTYGGPDGNPPWGVWVPLVVIGLPIWVYAVRNLIVEGKARTLRRQRGIARPVA